MKDFYDVMARFYDFFTWGSEKRYGPDKAKAFSAATGRALLVGVGTGIDFQYLPPGLDLTAIDISGAMLARASKRAASLGAQIELLRRNIEKSGFADNCFDTVITSCVFCSVQNPIKGLREIHRILKPDGNLIMLEHVQSGNPLLKPMLFLMNVLFPFGPDFTRDTLASVRAAGFKINSVRNLYMDIVKSVEANIWPMNESEEKWMKEKTTPSSA